MLQKNPKTAGEMHFMCSYCKNLIKKDQMPSRCVLNGLQVVEILAELSGLASNSFSGSDMHEMSNNFLMMKNPNVY